MCWNLYQWLHRFLQPRSRPRRKPYSQEDFEYFLFDAADKGNLRRLLKALRNVDVNTRNDLRQTALHVACRRGHAACINAILDCNPDVNIRDSDNCTPLNIYAHRYPAHKYRSMDILQRLLDAGADPNIPDKYDCYPLHFVADNHHFTVPLEFSRLLIRHNALINVVDIFGSTPLHYAVHQCNVKLVDLLLSNGANMTYELYAGSGQSKIVIYNQIRNYDVLKKFGEHVIYRNYCETGVRQPDLEEFCTFYSLFKVREKCEEEIEIFKRSKFGDFNITYFDILSSSPYKLSKYMRNSEVLNLLMNFDTTQFTFRCYLDLNISRGLKLHQAYIRGVEFFTTVIPVLPDICVDIIIGYLGEVDLINLQRAISC